MTFGREAVIMTNSQPSYDGALWHLSLTITCEPDKAETAYTHVTLSRATPQVDGEREWAQQNIVLPTEVDMCPPRPGFGLVAYIHHQLTLVQEALTEYGFDEVFGGNLTTISDDIGVSVPWSNAHTRYTTSEGTAAPSVQPELPFA